MGQGAGIDWFQWVRESVAGLASLALGTADSRGRRGADPPGGGPSARASGPDGITNQIFIF